MRYRIQIKGKYHYGTYEWCLEVAEEVYQKTGVILGIMEVE